MRAARLHEYTEDMGDGLSIDEIDDVQLNPGDGRGMRILHACSGPDRPGSYARQLATMNIGCFDYDVLVDARAVCPECGSAASVSDLLRQGGCTCSTDPDE